MDIARCLDTIDQLCARPFPAAPGWSRLGREGPGYFLTEWTDDTGGCDGEDTLPARAAGDPPPLTAGDLAALRDALAQRLDTRWPPHPRLGTATLRVRLERAEEIPEPWASMAVLVDDMHLWEAQEHGRWIALGVARGEEHVTPARLIVTVTDIPPV
ncbi:hypothetical protein AB0D49_24855 [Streptomyces sp. NPDC048290]|uniref:hypothetical protein n=1 Tax=Streptomyces sp. NPDC048290 TaxID=3155811 RepID=UPI003440E75E